MQHIYAYINMMIIIFIVTKNIWNICGHWKYNLNMLCDNTCSWSYMCLADWPCCSPPYFVILFVETESIQSGIFTFWYIPFPHSHDSQQIYFYWQFVGCADFVPDRIKQDGFFKSGDFESLHYVVGKARSWVHSQPTLHVVSLQSIDYKLKQSWGEYEINQYSLSIT